MFVRDCMTHNPITVRPESDPLAGMMLLKSCGFRHLPVVDADGRLVGIVDRADLELFLSKAGSPGIIGQLAELSSRIARVQGNISSVVAYDAGQPGRINITLRVEGAGQETVLKAVSGLAELDALHAWGREVDPKDPGDF